MSLTTALRAEGYRIQAFTDGGPALNAMRQYPPDAVVLDTKLPSMDGMEVLRRLREKSDLPVILLSSSDDELDELFGLKLGADDYIRKPFSLRVLLERINSTLRRVRLTKTVSNVPVETDVIDHGRLFIDTQRHVCNWNSVPIKLTATEFTLLKSLAQSPGVVWSRTALMEAAYGSQTHVYDRTIDSHIKRLRRKLRRADPDFNAIETLYGVGYRFRDT